ncbi:TetR/AcrR family transcriptional regulator [Robbsia sp. KACC 23696]|uniref:TetR/AcrR family transcriptional regulator n=1 Tax=Robbsia sp. KACC 23696 TaxID=3149231 RepID=UPI00325BB66E
MPDASPFSVVDGLDAQAVDKRAASDGVASTLPSQPAALLTEAASTPSRPKRKNDPEQTRQNILEVATEEFASNGLAGARVDAIAAKTRTTKRMIYYYFGSKDELYQAVLDQAYGGIRHNEERLHLLGLPPVEAMRTLVGMTFDYHDAHPDFVRLVSIENFQQAAFLKRSKTSRGRNATAILLLEQILERGVAAGVFRANVDAIDLHMLMSSFSFHRVLNRYTFGTLFGRDPLLSSQRPAQRQMLVEAVLAYLRPDAVAT